MKQSDKFKQTEIGKIPKDWGIVKLSDVAVVNNLTLDNSFSYREIEYIDIAAVNQGFISEIKTIPLKEAPSRAKRIVRNNDIVLSTVRPNLKHFAFMKNVKPNTVASTGFAVITSKNIHPQFLYYYISMDRYTYYLSAIADMHTSVYPACNPDVIENSLIPYPPFPEQRAIAKILSDLDEKIELNRQMNKTLESIAQTIFKHWFVDFEFPNEQGKPYKLSGGKMVMSDVGQIPIGWEIQNLGRIIEITSGKRPTEKSESKSDEFCVPLYGASSIVGYVKESLCDEQILIIGRVGTHGVVQRIKPPAFPSDNTLIIRPKYYEYTYQILKNIDYDAYNVGTTQPLITQSSVKDIDVVIPATLVLMKFESIVTCLYSKIHENLAENEHLSQIRDSLLPELMLGEVKVLYK